MHVVPDASTDPAEGDLLRLRTTVQSLEHEVARVIVGQDLVVRGVTIALLAGGHVLLEGVPGLGKTLLVRTIARALRLQYSRIQFTPDLMPADILGTNVLLETQHGGSRAFQFQPGPIFANLVLADEINRATPKTQSALLEAMQEQAVTRRQHQSPAAAAVLRAGDPEPDRAGRHLSAARGPARPLLLQAQRRLSRRAPSLPRSSIAPPARASSRRPRSPMLPASSSCSSSRARFPSPRTSPTTPCAWCWPATPSCPKPPKRRKRNVRFGASPRAAQAIILAAQDPRRPRRALQRGVRRRPARGPPGAAPPSDPQLMKPKPEA